jgi:hypothetical protein
MHKFYRLDNFRYEYSLLFLKHNQCLDLFYNIEKKIKLSHKLALK